jgi:hypothetical protein
MRFRPLSGPVRATIRASSAPSGIFSAVEERPDELVVARGIAS